MVGDLAFTGWRREDVEALGAGGRCCEAAGALFFVEAKGACAIGGPLEPGEVARVFKKLAERAGIDPGAISGHSVRVGMAQDLVAHGAELPAVMQAGRWKSPTIPSRYAERLAAGKGAVAQYYSRRGLIAVHQRGQDGA